MTRPPSPSRRGLLFAAGTALAGAGLSARAAHAGGVAQPAAPAEDSGLEPFWGAHQGGILTPQQVHTYFAALDVSAERRADVEKLLRIWTETAARLTSGAGSEGGRVETGDDIGETFGLPPARLTITFGVGATLFEKDGKDRFGLAARRPEALVDLPRFNGDQMVPEHTGGDLSIQACAEDPQVAFDAVRQLARAAYGAAEIRWVQSGFMPRPVGGATARNLMGFKDGTNNPSPADAGLMDQVVWVGEEGPAWMRGGSYMVARRIRIALEHWDRMQIAFQEQAMGRKKVSGAPLGKEKETDPVDLDAADADGNPVIPENAHVRLAAPAANDGARMLRRGYSYNDGVNLTAERWPPWRQGMEYDAGLLFICYQRDPRTGFMEVFDTMSKIDMLNQFTTHVGGGLFACPPGAQPGGFVGERLFAEA